MKKEQLFRVLGMVEDDFIKEAEDEKDIRGILFVKTAGWKWAAAAAGILLAAGLGFSKSFLVMNNKNTSTTGRVEMEALEDIAEAEDAGLSETAAQTYAAASAANENGAGAGKAELSSTAGALWEDSKEGVESNLSASFYEDKMVLYLEIIKEVYESYEGEILYLDLGKVSNLTVEQKEILQDTLMTQYGMEVIAKNFEGLSRQEVLDEETAKRAEIYLSIEVTEEKENGFAFTVLTWIGEDNRREDYCAEYGQNGWSYEFEGHSAK